MGVVEIFTKYKSQSVNIDNLGKDQTILGFKIPLNTGKIARIFLGVTPSLPKKQGDPSVITLKVPSVPGKMPEIPSSVKSVSETAVLVSQNSFYENSEELETNAKTSDTKESSEKKQKPSDISRIENTETKIEDTENSTNNEQSPEVKQEVLNILKSDDTPEINEENQVIEISEEPIS